MAKSLWSDVGQNTGALTVKTFDECYKELADFLYDRGIASDKLDGDPVFELAKTYAAHEQQTFEEDS